MGKTSFIKISLAVPVLFYCLFSTMTVYGEEQLPVEDATSEKSLYTSMLDRSHSYLLNKVNGPAVWFDSFFGNPRTENLEQPSTLIRLRIASRLTEGEGFSFPVRLRARIRVPKASRKLKLIIIGEGDDEFETTREEDPSTTIKKDGETENNTNVGLRYKAYNTLRSKLHLSVGGRLYSPFEYYYRIRYRRIIHIGSDNIVAFNESGYWNSINGYGTTVTLDYDRALSETLTGRLSLSGIHAEINKESAWGVVWAVTTSLFKKFSAKTAASLDLSAFGETKPNTKVTNYRVGGRMRKNVLRPWLFLEISPEVTFPLDDLTGERDAIGAIQLMLEIQIAAK